MNLVRGDSIQVFIQITTSSPIYTLTNANLARSSQIIAEDPPGSPSTYVHHLNDILIIKLANLYYCYRVQQNGSGGYNVIKVKINTPADFDSITGMKILAGDPFGNAITVVIHGSTTPNDGAFTLSLTQATGTPLSLTPIILGNSSNFVDWSDDWQGNQRLLLYRGNGQTYIRTTGGYTTSTKLAVNPTYITASLIQQVFLVLSLPTNELSGSLFISPGTAATSTQALVVSTTKYKYCTDKIRNFLVYGSADYSFVWISVYTDGKLAQTVLSANSGFDQFSSANTLKVTVSGNIAFVLQSTKLIVYQNAATSVTASKVQKVKQFMLSLVLNKFQQNLILNMFYFNVFLYHKIYIKMQFNLNSYFKNIIVSVYTLNTQLLNFIIFITNLNQQVALFISLNTLAQSYVWNSKNQLYLKNYTLLPYFLILMCLSHNHLSNRQLFFSNLTIEKQ